MKHRDGIAGVGVAGFLAIMAVAAPPAQAASGDDGTTTFELARSSEALMELTASGPGTDWGARGRESAVATVTVDGHYTEDAILFAGERPFNYRLALGRLAAGRHRVSVRFNRSKSTAGASAIDVARIRVRGAPRGSRDPIFRYAPVLYGRDLPDLPGRYENNRTDVPLLLFHTTTVDGAGNRTIEYSVVWSNEDGGTSVSALMARWGRTTDIEWIYRVRVDPSGRRIGEWYQDPAHGTLPFDGLHRNGHPLLQTSGINNGVLPVRDRSRASGYRLWLNPSPNLRHGLARESELDVHPWTYGVTAEEVVRERKVEAHASARTRKLSDARNYLFVRLVKSTSYAGPHDYLNWVGAAVAVRLSGRAGWFRSDHDRADWSVGRDGTVATSIELPPGTTAGDIRAIGVSPDVVGHVDSGWSIRVTAIKRAFFLGPDYTPLRRIFSWRGSITLTSGGKVTRIA